MPSYFADTPGYQSQRSPRAVAISVAIHAGGLAALLLMPAAVAVLDKDEPTRSVFIPIDPPEVTPTPTPSPASSEARETTIETPRPPLDVNRSKPDVETGEVTDDPPLPPVGGTGSGEGTGPAPTPTPTPSASPAPPPVIVAASPDPRYAGQLQPEYPGDEARREREGRVRIRVLVGANGRVIRAQRLEATSDSFWRATERQALNRWRFRPATEDGRAVEGWYSTTVVFRLDQS